MRPRGHPLEPPSNPTSHRKAAEPSAAAVVRRVFCLRPEFRVQGRKAHTYARGVREVAFLDRQQVQPSTRPAAARATAHPPESRTAQHAAEAAAAAAAVVSTCWHHSMGPREQENALTFSGRYVRNLNF